MYFFQGRYSGRYLPMFTNRSRVSTQASRRASGTMCRPPGQARRRQHRCSHRSTQGSKMSGLSGLSRRRDREDVSARSVRRHFGATFDFGRTYPVSPGTWSRYHSYSRCHRGLSSFTIRYGPLVNNILRFRFFASCSFFHYSCFQLCLAGVGFL